MDGGGRGFGAERSKSLLVGEKRGLRDQNVETGIDASKVARFRQFEIALAGLLGFYLLLDLFGENADGGHRIFDLLEGSEHGLAVAGHAGVIECGELLDRGAAEAGIKDSFGKRWTDGPKTAGPGQEIFQAELSKPPPALRVRLG